MKKITFFCVVICVALLSCTKDKTDYQSEIDQIVEEYDEFKEVARAQAENYIVLIHALNGSFYAGYNETRIEILDRRSGQAIQPTAVTFLPIKVSEREESQSCPHLYNMEYVPAENYFSGYAVFPHLADQTENWRFHIGFTVAGQTYQVQPETSVKKQMNKNRNMTSFVGEDNQLYFIALVSPQKPKVGENDLVAGIYKFDPPSSLPSGNSLDPTQFSYPPVTGYTLELDPRMPEPSMGNHSSPNNKNLTQRNDGLYQGVVNYTMTGNWTLNFILLDQHNKRVKGTKVPNDFTPGVEGVKSDLHLDILF